MNNSICRAHKGHSEECSPEWTAGTQMVLLSLFVVHTVIFVIHALSFVFWNLNRFRRWEWTNFFSVQLGSLASAMFGMLGYGGLMLPSWLGYVSVAFVTVAVLCAIFSIGYFIYTWIEITRLKDLIVYKSLRNYGPLYWTTMCIWGAIFACSNMLAVFPSFYNICQRLAMASTALIVLVNSIPMVWFAMKIIIQL